MTADPWTSTLGRTTEAPAFHRELVDLGRLRPPAVGQASVEIIRVDLDPEISRRR
jgi:hypothetical protein